MHGALVGAGSLWLGNEGSNCYLFIISDTCSNGEPQSNTLLRDCQGDCRTHKQKATHILVLFTHPFKNGQHSFHMVTLLDMPRILVMPNWRLSVDWLQQMRSDMRMPTPRLWRSFLSLTLKVPCWLLLTWWGRKFPCLLTWCMMDRMNSFLMITHWLLRGLGCTLLGTMPTSWNIW